MTTHPTPDRFDREHAYAQMQKLTLQVAVQLAKFTVGRLLQEDWSGQVRALSTEQFPEVLRRARITADRIDLSDPEWELERSFDDATHQLFMYAIKAGIDRSLGMRIADFGENSFLAKQVDLISAVMKRELQSHSLLDGVGKCALADLSHVSYAFAEVLSAEWMRRGGRELPDSVELLVLLLSKSLEDLLDMESTFKYDDDGLPIRHAPGDFTIFGARAILVSQIPILAAGQIPFRSVGWEDLDLTDVISRSIAVAAPEVLAGRREAELQKEFKELLVVASKSLVEWQQIHHRPLVSPYGLSPDEAEAWICKWMLHMGAKGAVTTQYVGDGGIDVEADHYIAQVKMYSGSVGIASLREFAGVAFVDEDGRRPLFFTTGSYPAAGPGLADRAKMALFFFDLATGSVTGANDLGKQYVEHGFLSAH